MKVKIICVGRAKADFVKEGEAEYLKRLAPMLPIEVVEIKENESPAQKLRSEEYLVALDPGGKAHTSEEFAAWLDKIMTTQRSLVFAIGGPDGIDEAVKQRANYTLSLSKLTFPHEMARLILAEQIYRALTILRGHPYHR